MTIKRIAIGLILVSTAGAGVREYAPADKHLDLAWVASLTQRGGALDAHISGSKKDGSLKYIGMPVGGIGCGTVYLGGDGRLWVWDIFNQFSSGVIDQQCEWNPELKNFPAHKQLNARSGANYVNPFTPDTCPPAFQQGFGIRIGDRYCRFEEKDWADVEFEGNWPVGTVTYRDPAMPVEVALHAFSPFIPLDVADSSLPLTCMEFTVRNTSTQPVTADLSGWLENAVGINSRKKHALQFETQRSSEGVLKTMLHRASIADEGVPAVVRPDIVFADFEGTTYGDWIATGEAFGSGPIHKGEVPGIQGDLHMQGDGAVSSHASAPGTGTRVKDGKQGTLTSPVFTIERNGIHFLIGGGPHQGKTCLNLLVDGKVVQSATGKKENRMRLASFAVGDLIGRQAQLQLVDAESGAWGNIGIDHIVFSDTSLEKPFDFKKAGDFGTMALSVMDPSAEAIKEGWQSTLVLPPGEERQVVFLLSWYFPNIYPLPGFPNKQHQYAIRFADAGAVAKFAASGYARLAGDTKEWVETWYDSTLPQWFLDRTILTADTLQTANCMIFEDGQFWAWEGVGSCPGTCAHVWQYAQAMARLFPSLERNLREVTDYGYAQKENGAVMFRGVGPTMPAVDGQAGIVLRTYREHLISPDDAFLRRVWPQTKRAMQYLIDEDGNADGILEGAQHNTLDAEWYGPVAWLSGEYLAALRAGEEMARLIGDTAFAEEVHGIFTRGQVNLVDRLYNGEYFINLPDPAHTNAINSGTGCLIDQVFGQSWAFQVGLGRILPEKETRSALDALWKYNFTPDVGVYREKYTQGRWYAVPGESGLLMCTFPKPDWDFEKASGQGKGFAQYFNECMSGFEYQVASHMIYEGTPDLVGKGLAITRAVHDRYSPAKRNPYNEIECSDHYARAMASYAVFLASCGFDYDGPANMIGFNPVIHPENFRAPFTAAEGWGTFSQTINEKGMQAELRVNWGSVSIQTLRLAPNGMDVKHATVTCSGKMINAKLATNRNGAVIEFEAPVRISAGQMLEVVLR